ncbi:2'-5' RNA ligase family protein [Candidatus Parcubacteria bacterium]|nr:2'-5' RNA ligase family protein [Candidatus Parcubacteria bacterium]
MKYFIGHLISGKAAEWHTNTAKKISEKFNTWKIYEKIPPHITIFYPEGVEDINAIRNYIQDWTRKNKALGSFRLSEFDRFDDRVVFAKVEADESAIKAIEDLRKGLQDMTGITEDFPNWHPHATLAYKLSPEEINKIWEYTNELDKPNFTLLLNNITIFRYAEDQKWVVDESFLLPQF